MNPAAQSLIARLGLAPLPHEGGYFRRTWTSPDTLPDGRPAGTAIYFLLTPEGFSALHRMRTAEVWHFHAGDRIEHLQLFPNERKTATSCLTILGPEVLAGDTPQLTVPGGVWQGARLAPGAAEHGWALVGCTMAPGWDDREFELGDRAALTAACPAEAARIAALTR